MCCTRPCCQLLDKHDGDHHQEEGDDDNMMMMMGMLRMRIRMKIVLSSIAVPCSWPVPQAIYPCLLRCVKCLDKSLDRGPLQTAAAFGCGLLSFSSALLPGSRMLEILKVQGHNPTLVVLYGHVAPQGHLRLSRRTSGSLTTGVCEREGGRKRADTGAVWPMPIVGNGITCRGEATCSPYDTGLGHFHSPT